MLGPLALQRNCDNRFQKQWWPGPQEVIAAYVSMTSDQDCVKLDPNEHGIHYVVIIVISQRPGSSQVS